MSDVITKILSELLLAAITVTFGYLSLYIKRKLHTNKLDVYLNILEDVTANTVLAFMQTTVDNMKANGTFNQEVAESIKSDAIEKIKLQLPNDIEKFFKQTGIDIDTLIDSYLEKQVFLMKDTNEC